MPMDHCMKLCAMLLSTENYSNYSNGEEYRVYMVES